MKLIKEFLVDESNRFAHEIICAIGEKGPIYNPVVLYGRSGNGKSFLVKKLVKRLENENRTVMVLGTQSFRTALIESLRNCMGNFSIPAFCEKYTKADVLVIEDLQSLKGAESTQETLVEIADYYIENNKQIVFTMDCHPQDLDGFYARLKSKFSWGVQVKIDAPSEKMKMNF